MRKLLPFILSTFLLYNGCKDITVSSKQQVFRYNQESGISSLDPAFARDQANGWAVNMLFNGLVQLDSNLNIQPAIAYRWEMLDNGKRYRFYLRDDVRFHDNICFKDSKFRYVTSSDFVYSFGRILDPAVASPGAWIFSALAKDTPFLAVNDSIFDIRLQRPYPPLLGMLSMSYCSVVPHEAVTHYGPRFREHPVGTGPFQFAFWQEQEALVVHRNPHYFEMEAGSRLPYLDAVMVEFLPDKQSAFLAFIQGRLDFISGVDPAFKDEVLEQDGSLKSKYKGKIHLQRSPYLNTEYLGMLQNPEKAAAHPALLDVKVRRALNHAIDRQQMMRYLRNNIGIPGTAGLIPPGLPGFDSSRMHHYAYHPTLAKQLLEEAGYPAGSIQLTLETNPAYLDLCIFIQRQFKSVGVDLSINTSPGPTLRQRINKGEAGMFRASWIADYPDAENYLALAYGPNAAPAGPNYTQFNDPTYNLLYERSQSIANDIERADLYREMDSILIAQAPYLVLYYDQVLHLVHPKIRGLRANAMNMLDLKRVQFATENSFKK